MGTGNINYITAAFYCFLGAVLGEYISFAVGKNFQHRVRHWLIFQRHPEWLNKTDLFFERFGIASLALGRFVGPIRAFVPMIAGMSSMPLLRFQISNVASAVVWAPLYLIPGVLIGASTQLENEATGWLVGNLVIMIHSGWMVSVYVRNWWRVRHHDQQHRYDHRFLGLKIIALVAVTLSALLFLLLGPYSALFYTLLDIILSIVTTKSPQLG